MIESNFYAEAKTWQTVIGSVLGFIALMFGALFNSWLNRRRDDRLHHEESIAVAAALYGEILPLREAMAKLARGVAKRFNDHGTGRFRGEPFDASFREMYLIPEVRLYYALSDKVGKLPQGILLPIVAFYSSYQQALDGLLKLEEREDRGFSYGVLWFLDPAISAVNDVTPALREIEGLIGVEESSPIPDLEVAEEVRDLEHEFQEEYQSTRDSEN